MHLSSFFNYYKIGRFIFGLTLLIAFQIAGLPYAMPSLRNVLVIYIFIVLVRLIVTSERINYFDFLFDVVFVSAMVYISHGIYSYLTFIYLFPIFFSSVLIRKKKYFLFPVISLFLYGGVYYSYGTLWEKESLLTISLHFFAFFLIALAGDNLKERMEHQSRYIKRLEEERIRMQGYERLYRVSADLAHELRNPLASISAAVQFLGEGRSDREFIEMLSMETGRLTRLVNDFLLFSRPSDAPKEEVDVLDMLKMLLRDRGGGKEIILEGGESATVVANRTFVEVALNNIIKNALEAARTTVKVSLTRGVREVRIDVEDDGRGIEVSMQDKIFEPFFTTKANGTGLGLAIAYRIVTSFGGDIEVDTSPLQGARFSIMFPLKNQGVYYTP
ncbi:MAG: HAMP domain-containing histidine kinase [Alphaproteobacteria bacterium]|uniref:histidine kinase n=1 Tax=Candidatus Nitrobium versatile TaxID=2884831 RepID=A0A953J962_9BACT|nr:HAMP domain-containing histidine kinase [Candidatus Nitrobium versatile]